MKTRYLLSTLCSLVLIWSCEPDSYVMNHAPVVPDQSFTVSEDLPGGSPIGTLKATDKDGNALVFSLTEDQSGFFSLTKNGTLLLSEGQSLDYSKYPEHVLKVHVHDGTLGRLGTITIKVLKTDPENLPPNMEEQSFEVPEDIADTDTMGTVLASDPEDGTLSFAIVEDVDGLFEITEEGELSLLEGKSLDFETQTEHVLTVSVSDGNGFVQAAITIQVVDVDEPPTAANQGFEANEDIADTDVIDTLVASDPEGDVLTFAIVEDLDGLFEITETGELSLAEDKALDFEAKTEHVLTVSVSDGSNESVTFTVTVTVGNVIEDLFEDPASFILRFQVADGQNLTIGTNPNYNYNFTIDWGDGSPEEQVAQQNPSHVYATGDTYSVAIKGTFPALQMAWVPEPSRSALVDVSHWGANVWQSMELTFYNCQNLVGFTATDRPDLSQVTSMEGIFWGASSFNGDIGDWDTSNVTNMKAVFYDAINFNGNISQWETGNVTDMATMFQGATSFNQDIGEWDTKKVNDLFQMFAGASSFNIDISQWETVNVTRMTGMFALATSFDQNLGNWNISKITGATGLQNMFALSGISPTNYSSTLRGWAALGNGDIPDGLNLGAVPVGYCNDQETIDARAILTVDNGWSINDGGAVNCP